MSTVSCRVCGDGWSNESYELGQCCGYPLTVNEPAHVSKSSEKKAVDAIIEEVNKFSWGKVASVDHPAASEEK